MALFKTIEKLAEFVPVLESAEFKTVKPALDAAEDQYLSRQVMGATLYTNLHNAYQSQEEAITDPAIATLLPYARRVSAHLGMANIVDLVNVQFTSGGLMVGNTENMSPAAKWRTDDFKRQHLKLGYYALDKLVTVLHDQYSGYPAYTDIAKEWGNGIVRNAVQVQKHVNIGTSAYLFHLLRPVIREVQETTLRSIVNEPATYDYLVATFGINYDVVTTELELRTAIERLLVYEAMSRSAVNLSLAVNDEGITTFSATMNGDGRGGGVPATNERVNAMASYYKGRSEEAKQEVVRLLRVNAESGSSFYAAYLASAAYQAGQTKAYQPNTDLNTFFTGM